MKMMNLFPIFFFSFTFYHLMSFRESETDESRESVVIYSIWHNPNNKQNILHNNDIAMFFPLVLLKMTF